MDIPRSLLLALLILLPELSLAEPDAEASRASVRDGRRMWVAFEAVHYAGTSKQGNLANQLFKSGYASGKSFLKALREESIRDEDLRAELPIGISMLLHDGPNISDDFILGRIYESLQQYAEEKLREGLEDHSHDGELRASWARTKLLEMNLGLIFPELETD